MKLFKYGGRTNFGEHISFRYANLYTGNNTATRQNCIQVSATDIKAMKKLIICQRAFFVKMQCVS